MKQQQSFSSNDQNTASPAAGWKDQSTLVSGSGEYQSDTRYYTTVPKEGHVRGVQLSAPPIVSIDFEVSNAVGSHQPDRDE